MKITVELPDYFEDEDSLGELVIKEISRQSLESVRHVATKSAEQEVKKVFTDAYQKALDKLLEETLLDRFQLTNEYGEIKSDPTTLRELIIKMAKERLDTKVDSKTGERPTYNRPSSTIVEYMANKAIGTVIESHISEVESKIQTQAKEAMLKHLQGSK